MKTQVLVVATGTRGDVQPMLVLAAELQKSFRDHVQVYILTHQNFTKWAQENFHLSCRKKAVTKSEVKGINAEYLPDELNGDHCIHYNAERLLNTPDMAEAISNGDTFGYMKGALEQREGMLSIVNDIFAACMAEEKENCIEVLISNSPAAPQCHPIAERLRLKMGVISFFPVHPTKAFAPISGSWFGGWGWMNKMLHMLFRRTTWYFLGPDMQVWRKQLGLGPIPFHDYYREMDNIPYLYAYSPSILPCSSDWPNSITVGGYLFMENPDSEKDLHLNKDLVTFLEEDSIDGDESESQKAVKEKKVIYIGFGSMPAPLSKKFEVLLQELLSISPPDMKFLIYMGGIQVEPDMNKEIKGLWDLQWNNRVMLVGSIPHSKVFPKCRVVVHHGGSGTTAAALKAGTPQVICPFFFDQPFWAETMGKVGVSPWPPLAFSKVSAEGLLQAIEEMGGNPEVIKRCLQLSQIVKSEDGLGMALKWTKDLIEQSLK